MTGAGVLDGICVVEMGDWIAAPFAASVLGDFGADVIKLEIPGRLDQGRRMGGVPEHGTRSPVFAAFARNKRSVTVDLREEQGRRAAHRILQNADVLVTNMRQEWLAERELGALQLHERFPHLVILAITGFGLTGPKKDQGAVDRVAQAFAGLTYMTGYEDRPPVKAGLAVADYTTGWVGALGVVLALLERRRSGAGQVVDLGLYEPLLPMLAELLAEFREQGTVRGRSGNYSSGVSPGGVFRCADGEWIQISASSDRLFRRLMVGIGRQDLADDEGFATVAERDRRRDELEAAIAEWARTRTRDEIEDLLTGWKVPVAKVQTIRDVVEDAHTRARENFAVLDDADLGSIMAVSPLPRLTRTPGAIRAPGPELGRDTAEVLRRAAGVSGEELEALRSGGVV